MKSSGVFRAMSCALSFMAVFSVFLAASQEEGGKSGAAPEKTVIVEKLSRIVEIRKRELDLQQGLYADDRISDVSGARIALARARIDLAKERKDLRKVANELENIIAVKKLMFESAKLQQELGGGSSIETHIELLKTEIELERVKLEMQKE